MKKTIVCHTGCLLFWLLLLTGNAFTLQAQKIYVNDWESLEGWKLEVTNPNDCADKKSFGIVNTVDAAGVNDGYNANGTCIKMYLPQCQWIANSPHKRSEIRNSTSSWTEYNQERWYALSILVDTSYQFSGNDIVFQFHDAPDSCDNWRNPPFDVGISAAGEWTMGAKHSCDHDAACDNNRPGCDLNHMPETPLAWIGGSKSVVKGKWTHFVFNIVWDRSAGTGKARAWLKDDHHNNANGTQVINETNIRMGYNDTKTHYTKMGLYHTWHSSWTKDTNAAPKILYYDRFLVGGGQESVGTMMWKGADNAEAGKTPVRASSTGRTGTKKHRRRNETGSTQ